MVLDEKLCDAADALLKKYFQYYEEQDDGLTREQYKKDESRRNTLEDHEIRSTWRTQAMITNDEFTDVAREFVPNFKGSGEVIVNITN